MANTCWAADTGDPEGVGGPSMMIAPARPRPGDSIQGCVRPGYFAKRKGLEYLERPEYACKHRDGCLHGKAEEHRPPAWDPPPEVFADARKRDPKRKLGPVAPLVGPGWTCQPEKPGRKPARRKPVKRKPARGKRKAR